MKIVSSMRTTIPVGHNFNHQFLAEGDAVSFGLVSGPAGMQVSASGALSWVIQGDSGTAYLFPSDIIYIMV